jgi:hypothetical protein
MLQWLAEFALAEQWDVLVRESPESVAQRLADQTQAMWVMPTRSTEYKFNGMVTDQGFHVSSYWPSPFGWPTITGTFTPTPGGTLIHCLLWHWPYGRMATSALFVTIWALAAGDFPWDWALAFGALAAAAVTIVWRCAFYWRGPQMKAKFDEVIVSKNVGSPKVGSDLNITSSS